jgi:hypothetical protein
MPSSSGGHPEERFARSRTRCLVEVADLRLDEAGMRSYQKECLDAGQQPCFTFGKTLCTSASPLRRCRRTRIVLLLHPDRHSPINFIMVVTKTHKTTQLVSTLSTPRLPTHRPPPNLLVFRLVQHFAQAACRSGVAIAIAICNSQEDASTLHHVSAKTLMISPSATPLELNFSAKASLSSHSRCTPTSLVISAHC